MMMPDTKKKLLWSTAAVATCLAIPASLPAWQEQAQQPDWREFIQLAAVSPSSYLGVDVMEVEKERAHALNLKEEYGVEITRLVDDSPAGKAGLKKGDVVLEYNGQRVEGTQQFVRLVHETPVGRNIRLLVSRNGATQTLTVTTAARKGPNIELGLVHPMATPMAPMPPEAPFALDLGDLTDGRAMIMTPRSNTTYLGVEVEPLTPQLAQYFGVHEGTTGLLVRNVATGSPAEKAGIKAGDVITKLDNTPIASAHDLTSRLRPTNGATSRTATVTIIREKHEMPMTVTVESRNRSSSTPAAPRVRSVSTRDRV